MIVLPDERVPVARLLAFLTAGERLAHECAARQARLMADRGRSADAQVLHTQSRQEYGHALLFQAAARWISPRGVGACPLLPALEECRDRLDRALSRGNLVESVLVEQVILEGLGHAILARIEAGLVKRGAPFQRLRRMLLHQEELHRNFGLRFLEGAIAAGETSPPALRQVAADYLPCAHAMIVSLSDLFADVREDAAAWAADARQMLPSWLDPGFGSPAAS